IEECPWQSALTQAFARYGARTKLPSLWFYGDNYSYFSRCLGKGLQAKYAGAGGNVQLVAFGVFRNDSHGMFNSSAGLPIWLPEVERFLEALGLPSKPSVTVSDVPRPSASGFAKLEDIAAVPGLRDSGRNGYAAYLKLGL